MNLVIYEREKNCMFCAMKIQRIAFRQSKLEGIFTGNFKIFKLCLVTELISMNFEIKHILLHTLVHWGENWRHLRSASYFWDRTYNLCPETAQPNFDGK